MTGVDWVGIDILCTQGNKNTPYGMFSFGYKSI